MYLPNVLSYLKSLPYAKVSTDDRQILVRCPFCGDSIKNNTSTHFSIKINVDNNEPMIYQCFQPDYKCTASGIMTTEVMQRLGCMDMEVLLELSKYNSKMDIGHNNYDKIYNRNKKDYDILNIKRSDNEKKLKYINNRLGLDLSISDLSDLKISLSLYDFLNNNDIRKLSFKESYCNKLDLATIGFLSMYEDYLLLRDISKDRITGKRYNLYRIRGNPSPDDTKIYTIPCEIDIVSPYPTILNIAEGPFSILGAYFNTDYMRDNNYNKIFTSNSGTGFNKTITQITKQYGLTNCIINIFSDSEVDYKIYKKLYKTLKNHIRIEDFNVLYNTKKEDFGYSTDNIHLNSIKITN